MAAWGNAAYSGAATQIDEARAFVIACTLIAQHGDQVASFLQAKIDALWASGEYEYAAICTADQILERLSVGHA